MFCTKCGKDLRDDDRFCPQCGNQIGLATPIVPASSSLPARLMLDKQRKKVAGVCGGFARYFDMDLTLMRVLWLAIAICTGVGFIVYLAAWIILPSDDDFFEAQYPQRN